MNVSTSTNPTMVEEIRRQQQKRKADAAQWGSSYTVGTITIDHIDFLLAELDRLKAENQKLRSTNEELRKDCRRAWLAS